MPDAAWWDGPLVGFDLETTAPDPQTAKIVTAAVVTVNPPPPGERRRPFTHREWLAHPGEPIPEGATAVHGITTAFAFEHGAPLRNVVAEVCEALRHALLQGAALAVFNARYDLTVVQRLCERFGITPPWQGIGVRAFDPFVIDKHLDRYRKSYPHGHTAESAAAAGIPSSRTLAGMAAHYGADLSDAHDAYADALAACRVTWAIAVRGQVIRRVRNAREGAELAELQREWESVRYDLGRLTAWQKRIALAERDRFAAYKAEQGEHEEAARIRAEVGWPILEPPVREAVT
jgi:DNA polymerase-3 subunit epsilon